MIIAAIAVTAAAGLTAGGLLIYHYVGPDSGIQACRQLANNEGFQFFDETSASDSDKFSAAHDGFAESRYGDLAAIGPNAVGLDGALFNTGPGSVPIPADLKLSALIQLTDDYNQLADACTSHGVLVSEVHPSLPG